MATYKNFGEATKALKSNFNKARRKLPDVLANTGTNFFVDNFNRQGFLDSHLENWKIPQRKITGTKAYKYPKKKDLGRRTRATLVKSGRLRRAVNNALILKSKDRIHWRVNLIYAARHNFGLNGMPKREFMGQSRILNRMFRKKIDATVMKALTNSGVR